MLYSYQTDKKCVHYSCCELIFPKFTQQLTAKNWCYDSAYHKQLITLLTMKYSNLNLLT